MIFFELRLSLLRLQTLTWICYRIGWYLMLDFDHILGDSKLANMIWTCFTSELHLEISDLVFRPMIFVVLIFATWNKSLFYESIFGYQSNIACTAHLTLPFHFPLCFVLPAKNTFNHHYPLANFILLVLKKSSIR